MRFCLIFSLSLWLGSTSLWSQSVNLGNDIDTCFNGNYLLQAPSGFSNFLWSDSSTNGFLVITADDTVWLQAENQFGQVSRDTIIIRLRQISEVGFGYVNQCAFDTTFFFGFPLNASFPPIVVWEWDFGDGLSGTGQEPFHIYTAENIFPAELIVANDLGCTDIYQFNVVTFLPPMANAGPDLVINFGGTDTLMPVIISGQQYVWIPSFYLSDDSVQAPVVLNPPGDLQFTLTLTDNITGCQASDDVLVLVNFPPDAKDDFATTPANQPTIINPLINDTDPDGDVLSISVTDTTDNGTITVNTDNTISYFPNQGFNGRDTLIYRACDLGNPPLCDLAFVYIIVANSKPLAMDDTITTEKNTEAAINVLLNDSDPNGQNLTITNIFDPQSGRVEDFGAGNFIYYPPDNFEGTDIFFYSVCDNGAPQLCDTAAVYVYVNVTPLRIINTFSPNNDNVRDFFTIEGISNFPDHRLTIFSRWGDIVYQTDNYKNDWDGRRGFREPLPDGIYFYSLEIADLQKTFTGYIMLKR